MMAALQECSHLRREEPPTGAPAVPGEEEKQAKKETQAVCAVGDRELIWKPKNILKVRRVNLA